MTFTATVGTSDHESFDLTDHLGDGPVVLAFFAGAFTPPCTNEMVALQDRLEEFEGYGRVPMGCRRPDERTALRRSARGGRIGLIFERYLSVRMEHHSEQDESR
nr:redoxin domain-containing protein [Natronorubrum halalkaliphilum]